MGGMEWVPAMVIGLVAGLVGLVVGLGGALVGLVAGLVGGLVAVIAGVGGALLGVVGSLVGAIWGVLTHLVRPVVVVIVAVVVLLFAWRASVHHRVVVETGGIEVLENRDSSIRVMDLAGEERPALPEDVVRLPAEAPDAAVRSLRVSDSTGLPPRQQLFSDVVDTWQADVYPSDKAAVRALLARIDKQIDILTADQKGPAEIQVQGKVRHELLVQVVDVLRETRPESRITFAQTPDESVMPPTDKQTVIVHVLSAQGAKGITPYVRMQAVGWEHSRSEQASFVNKPWADDFAAFANENAAGTYVVAVSQRPATSAEEAGRNALAVAAESLKHRVSDRMASQMRAALWRRADAERWLEDRIAAELQNNQIIADRFVQRLEAPYGEVWQTSLLVDASPKNIASLAGKCDSWMTLQERGAKRTALSVIGVIVLVCLVYAGLNAVTRGYFSWSLRAMAIAVAAAGIFLVLLFCMDSGRVAVQTNTEPQGYREDPTIQRQSTSHGQQTIQYTDIH